MEKASGVSVARSSSDDGAGTAGGGLAAGSGGVEQGGLASSPLGEDGAQSVVEARGGLKEEGGRGSAAGTAYTRACRSVRAAAAAPCSSAAESVAPGGRMLSLAMVAWMELMGMSPPRTRSCWDSCREYGYTGNNAQLGGGDRKCYHGYSNGSDKRKKVPHLSRTRRIPSEQSGEPNRNKHTLVNVTLESKFTQKKKVFTRKKKKKKKNHKQEICA